MEVNMKSTFRLPGLVLAFVLAVLPGALRGSDSAIAGDRGELTVLDWAGFGKTGPKEGKPFYEDFSRNNPHVRVEVREYDSDAEIHTAVTSHSVDADIIHPYTSWLKTWVDEGLVDEIKPDELKNFKNWDKVPTILKDLGKVNGKQYFIPWDVGFSSILYNTDKVKIIRSWDELLHPDPYYKGHVMMYDDNVGQSAVEVSAYIHGWNLANIAPDQLAIIAQEWKSLKESNLSLGQRPFWKTEGQLIQEMANGNIWVAYAWPSAYAELKSEGKNVAYANPVEGRISWVGFYGILRSTNNKSLALEFLDEKLSETTANNLVDAYGYAVANPDVWRKSDNPTLKELKLDDPSVLKGIHLPPDVTQKQLNDWGKMWTDVVKY
jgi:spermidine/putrescine-binding protein